MYSKNNIIVAIDVGNELCGVAVINPYSRSIEGFNVQNGLIFDKIRDYLNTEGVMVVIEDVLPYQKRLSMQLIDTCKFIGELTYRLKVEYNVNYLLISRNKVRKWVFDRFIDLCTERIDKKIAYLDDYGEKKGKRRYRNKSGELKKASFHYVDDRIIIEAMKRLWDIPTPKPGKQNIYGFKTHSWQALALGSCYIAQTD